MALIYCPECGNQSSDQAEACPKCAYPISKLNFNQNIKTSDNNTVIKNIEGLHYYYEQEFEEIYKSEERYQGAINWNAFLFTNLWCFFKGLWVPGLLITCCQILIYFFVPEYFISIDTGTLTPKIYLGIIFGLLVSIYLMFRGTWLLYHLKVKGKQYYNTFFVFILICLIFSVGKIAYDEYISDDPGGPTVGFGQSIQ